MVERYWPGLTEEKLRSALARVIQVSGQMRRAGMAVEYVSSTLVPTEEVVFCLFEGGSAEEIAEVNHRAQIPAERISEVIHVTAAQLSTEPAPPAPATRRGARQA